MSWCYISVWLDFISGLIVHGLLWKRGYNSNRRILITGLVFYIGPLLLLIIWIFGGKKDEKS
jgi:hypothetical protein